MENPGYYAIIPAVVRYSKKLSPNAKLLYGEITALANKSGYCWSTNQYFADLYGVHNSTISEWIGQLKDAGFIRYEVAENYKRKIYLTGGVPSKDGGGTAKSRWGVRQKDGNNNTNNNTNKTTIAPPT